MNTKRSGIALALCLDPLGRILIAQRSADQAFAGFWEFPGGKITPGESPQAAATRELTEETGLIATATGELPPVDWDYPDVRLRFFPVLCRLQAGPGAAPPGSGGMLWVSPDELDDYKFPPANVAIIGLLQRALR